MRDTPPRCVLGDLPPEHHVAGEREREPRRIAAGSVTRMYFVRVSPPRTLSKSDYTLARTCDAKLYFRENGYPDNRQHDPYLQLLAIGGYMVEALAKAKRADGIRLQYGGDPVDDFK